MKKLLALLLALVMVLALCACGAKTETPAPEAEAPAEEPAEDKIVFGYAGINLDEYQTRFYNAFVARCEELGIEVVLANADNSIDKQIADMDAFITQGVDGIFLCCTDADGIADVADKAVDAGIPVIEMGFGINAEKAFCYGPAQYDYGVAIYEYIAKYLDENPDAYLKIGYLWGFKEVPAVVDRYNGVFDNLSKNYPDRYEIVAEEVCNYIVDDAISAAEAWSIAHPDINCILSSNDEMLIGAINVFESAGIDVTKIITCGIDGSASAIPYIKEGKMSMSAACVVDATAAKSADRLLAAANGEAMLGDESIDGVIMPVTIENVNEYSA